MWTYIIVGLVALAMVTTAVVTVDRYLAGVKESGRVEVREEWRIAGEKRRVMERTQSANAARGLQGDRAARTAKAKPIILTVEKIIEKPFYLDSCLDPAGLRCVNAALGGQSAAGCTVD